MRDIWTNLIYLSSLSYLCLLTFCIIYFRGTPYGPAVRILGFHPGGPGSTLGMGTNFPGVFLTFLSSTEISYVESQYQSEMFCSNNSTMTTS